MTRHLSQVRVRYADTDQMRVVHHGKYFEYFELGRSDLIRELGMPYSELESKGILLPVIEVSARYRRPAYYDDLLLVETTINEISSATLTIHYRILRDDEKECLVEGYTVHSFINATSRKPMRAPKEFLKLFDTKAS